MTLSIFSFMFFSSCNNQEPLSSRIPFRQVDLQVDTKSALNKELLVNGGYKIFVGGYKGIIIYRESSSVFRAFERSCTFQPEKECEIIEVDGSGLFFIDKCCNSTYDFSGNVTGGPAPERLLEYQTYLDEFGVLYVTNL